MTADHRISDVHIVSVTPRVPTEDLVALQCNLFTFGPAWTDATLYVHTREMQLLWVFVQFPCTLFILIFFCTAEAEVSTGCVSFLCCRKLQMLNIHRFQISDAFNLSLYNVYNVSNVRTFSLSV